MWVQNFLRNKSGNIGIMAAGALVMIISATGLAVDYSSMTNLQSQLQSDIDAAVLRAAASGEIEKANLITIASKGFGDDVTLSFEWPEDHIKMVGSTPYEPLFMGVMGASATEVITSATAPLGGDKSPVDLSLVLDLTTSMDENNKLGSMKSAVTDMIDQIDANDDADIRISIVPFSQYVKVVENEDIVPDWVDASDEGQNFPPTTGPVESACTGTITQETCHGDLDGVANSWQCDVCSEPTTWTQGTIPGPEKVWEGCVGSRNGNHATYPAYNNKKFPAVYDDGWGGVFNATRHACTAPVRVLSDDLEDVKEKVSWLWTYGETYIPAGLIWGWRTLDGEVPLGVPSQNGENRAKNLVLMTDGHNTLSRTSSGNKHHDGTDGLMANARTAALCNGIKNDGIQVFTIAYQVSSADPNGAATKQLLQNCASGSTKYYDASNAAELTQAFSDIAKNLVNVRLSN